MGFRVVIDKALDTWMLELKVSLTRTESAEVFVSGDTLLQWPEEGLRSVSNLPLERTTMFISEAAARSEGVCLEYTTEKQATSAAAILRTQLEEAGIQEEPRTVPAGRGGSVDLFREALAEYLTLPGMQAAILVSDQGLMISGVAIDGVDTVSIAALIVDTISSAQRLGAQARGGSLGTMTVEYENLNLIVAPFSPEVMLVIVAEPGSIAATSPRAGCTTPEKTCDPQSVRAPERADTQI